MKDRKKERFLSPNILPQNRNFLRISMKQRDILFKLPEMYYSPENPPANFIDRDYLFCCLKPHKPAKNTKQQALVIGRLLAVLGI
jgi:hypothetical protein